MAKQVTKTVNTAVRNSNNRGYEEPKYTAIIVNDRNEVRTRNTKEGEKPYRVFDARITDIESGEELSGLTQVNMSNMETKVNINDEFYVYPHPYTDKQGNERVSLECSVNTDYATQSSVLDFFKKHGC